MGSKTVRTESLTAPGALVARVFEVFTNASTSPALVETADGRRWVMKFAGAGSGPFGLLTEFLALGIAAAIGAPVPAAQPVWLPEGFPWMAGTDEFDAMLQRSWGWNLGVAFVPGARAVGADEVQRFDAAPLAAIARADALLHNVDRTPRNPNLLAAGRRTSGRSTTTPASTCRARSAAPCPPPRRCPPGHLLAGREGGPLPPLALAPLVAAAPAAWVAAAGTDRAGLTAALEAYVAAWRAVG